MTAKEILDWLDNQEEISVSDFAYGEFPQDTPLGAWEEVDSYGGEGQGDIWYSVKFFKDHGVFIKTDGYYVSFNGTEFEYGYGSEVFPKEVTKIEYV